MSDVVYRADGLPAGGTLLILWPAFNTADGKPVAAGTMSMPIGSSGSVSLALAPNEGASPAGTYYKVTLKLNDGTTSTEYWTVPKQGPVTITQIRSQVVPQSVAIQMASRQYVDAAVASKANDSGVLHVSGDEQVVGVKTFAVSPTVPTPMVDSAAAPKAYVDTAIANVSSGSFVRKSGDTMTGALTLSGDPTSTNQAANRHYVDTQVDTVSGSLAQKLGRQGDTPVTMGAMRFASQFANIQAAVTDAGTNGTVVIPSDYNGSDAFTNPNKIQVFDMRGDASGYRGFYNVRDFGAKPDDTTDDWAAIQAAIDAASAGTGPYGTVYVPRGTYYVGKPLHITKGIKFYGAGRGATTITGYSADQGPVLVVSPPTSLGYNGVPTGTSLATGAGNSMYLDGTFGYELNLREGGAVELNGRSAVTLELFYKPNLTVTAGQYNIISSSGSVTGPDGATAISIQHTDNDSITGLVTVGGAMRILQTPSNTISTGNVYHIALTYDGSTVRLFVNGALKASQAATGTVTQKMAEDFVIGPKVNGFMETTFVNLMTKGWVDSVRISATARYTSAFTAPTTKATYDGNTLLLLNFDNNYDEFTVATTMYGQQHLFLRRFGGGMGQVGNFHMADLSFIGSGPEFIYMISSMIDNVQVTAARRGFQFINNCYLNRLNSIRVVGNTLTQFGVAAGAASGVLTFEDLSISGAHYPLYVDTSSVVINGLWIETTAGTEIGAVLKGDMNSSAVIDQPEISAETNPNVIRDVFAIIGMGTVVMNGGIIETANGAPHVYVSGGGSVTHIGGNYSLIGTAPANVYQIATAPTNGVLLTSPIQQHMSIPWANNLSAIQTAQVKPNQSCTGNDSFSGLNATGSVVCSTPVGYTLTMVNVSANSPNNSTAYYFGGDVIDTNNTSFDAAKIQVPRAGTIKRIFVQQNVPAGNAGSTETVTHSVCINSSTNCFGAVGFAYNSGTTSGADATLSQAVTAGDMLAIKVQTPAWVTKPTNVRWYAVVYIE
ncbi:MAG: glycosyl hydrolase family 28-related protein [Terriglobales bacterium]